MAPFRSSISLWELNIYVACWPQAVLEEKDEYG